MQTFINIIIFCIIVFLYIHVNYQFKKGEDLEIYELDYTSNLGLMGEESVAHSSEYGQII